MLIEEDKIQDYILQHSGLDLKENSLFPLKEVIEKRMDMRDCKSSDEYLQFLQFHQGKEKEFKELINELTIKHTFFFRNSAHFEVLEKKIIPEIISGKRYQSKKIRILSAGCATGEEAYSIAISLFESIPDPESWDLEVKAADISIDALEKVRKGVYNRNSIREVKSKWLKKYFIPLDDNNDKVRISEKIKKIVNIEYLNLIGNEYPAGFDIIFCRNVFIYFNRDTCNKVIDKFYKSINENGFLFLGHAESLLGISNKFKLEDYSLAMVYKKCSQKELKGQISVEILIPPVLEDVRSAELPAESEMPKLNTTQSIINPIELFIEARSYFEVKRYDKALKLCLETIKIDDDFEECRLLIVDIYANTGRLDEAIAECRKLLNKNPTFAFGHFVLAILFSKKGLSSEAKKQFNNALYLDDSICMAFFNLAVIYQREGDINSALREYRNTITLLKNYSDDDILEHSGGFKAGFIMESCIKSISVLGGRDG